MDYPEVGGNGFEMKPGYIFKHQEQYYLIESVEGVVFTPPEAAPDPKEWVFGPLHDPRLGYRSLYHGGVKAVVMPLIEAQVESIRRRSKGRLVYRADAVSVGAEQGFSYNFKQEWS